MLNHWSRLELKTSMLKDNRVGHYIIININKIRHILKKS